MKAKVEKETKVLIPNEEHKTFVHGAEVLKVGSELEGEPKFIQGRRKGRDFVYRLFKTTDGKLIFLSDLKTEKQIKMENTETASGQDGAKTVVNLRPAEMFTRVKLIGMGIGALAGFAYAKKKGHDLKGSLKFIAGGIVLGYLGAYIVDSSKKATIKQ